MTPVMASDGIQDNDVTLLSYLMLSGSPLMPAAGIVLAGQLAGIAANPAMW